MKGMGEPLATFVRKHRHDARGFFLKTVAVPHLVLRARAPTDQDMYRTVLPDRDAQEKGEEAIIYPVQKTQEVFAFMITVGRGGTNDIIVTDARVSNFHAYLRESGGRWTITDAGSRNGTKVKGTELSAEKEHPLASGDEVELGGCPAVFLLPAELYELVQVE